MRLTGYATIFASLCALSGCDDGAQQGDNVAAPSANTAAASSDVDAYLSGFAAGNSDDCFREVQLQSANLRERQDAPPAIAPARVLVAVDASGSMAGRVSGRTKLDLAQAAARAFIEGLPADTEAGLIVFGQAGDNTSRGKAPSCAAVDLAVPLSRDRGGLIGGVSAVRAVGWTPLAAGLQRAETLLARGGKPGEQVIYVVSDGQETCGGDPVAVARAINAGPTKAVVNIIGFAVPSGEAAALAAVATAGGGRFVNVDASSKVDAAAASIRESGRQAANTLAESGTTAGNTIAVSGVAAKAQMCIGGLVARERIAVSGDIARKRIAGKDVALEERAEKIMAGRHAALERRTATFVREVDARRDAANRGVAAEAARVK